MKIPAKKLKKLLSAEAYRTLKLTGNLCKQSGYECFLVGGSVRDLLLDIPQIDIDIVTTNLSWISEISRTSHVKRVIKSQFCTRKLIFVNGLLFDIARARKETYPHPGALPAVKSGTILEDVHRRDFTINTLFMGITTSDFGIVYDHLDGIRDLQKGIIRVLHKESFKDDPTRIFRALRFKERFLFGFDTKTKSLLTDAINNGFIANLTPERIRKELFIALSEEQWDRILLCFSRTGILKQLGISHSLSKRSIKAFKRARELFKDEEQQWELTKLIIITESEQVKAIVSFAERTGLRKQELALLLEMRKNVKYLLNALSRRKIKNATLYQLLKPLPIEAYFYLVMRGTLLVQKQIELYLTNLKDVKTKITGNDLKMLGIKSGPLYTRILRKVLHERLNGNLKSKKDEIALAKRLGGRKHSQQ